MEKSARPTSRLWLKVLIINLLFAFTATAPVYEMSQKQINHFGLGVILGSMTIMNLLLGGGLSAFKQPEGKYLLRLALLCFLLSLAIFLVPTLFYPPQ